MTNEELAEKFSKSIEGVKISIVELQNKPYCNTHMEMMRRMDSFMGRVEQWMTTTEEYRRHQGEKIDHILEFIGKLPCEKRIGWWESINKQIAFMWVILSAVTLSLMAMGIKAVFAK
jgi:hypothetical protein